MSLKYNGQEIRAIYHGDDEIVRRIINETIVYENNKVRPNAFHFKNVSGVPNTIRLMKSSDKAPTITLQRSSGFSYESCDIYKGITLQPDEIVYLKGLNDTFQNDSGHNSFSSTGSVECHGTVMDIIDDGTDTLKFKDHSSYVIANIFRDMTTLLTAPELPATELVNSCYWGMFINCISLIDVPELPAKPNADSCYGNMFAGCTSIKKTPIFQKGGSPFCYCNMFSRCTSLVEVADLPTTYAYPGMYSYMFRGCTSLVIPPKILATELKNDCCSNMFAGCTSLTTAPELPAAKIDNSCYKSMFENCTSLTTAPELPAMELHRECYMSMFSGCTSLTTAPELPATPDATDVDCYSFMFFGCKKLNHVKVGATQWDDPSGTLVDKYKVSTSWLMNVSTEGTFIKPKELAVGVELGIYLNNPSGIPKGWKVVEF